MQAFEQAGRGRFVGYLPQGQSETDWQSMLVDNDMNLAGQSSAGGARSQDIEIAQPIFQSHFREL